MKAYLVESQSNSSTYRCVQGSESKVVGHQVVSSRGSPPKHVLVSGEASPKHYHFEGNYNYSMAIRPRTLELDDNKPLAESQWTTPTRARVEQLKKSGYSALDIRKETGVPRSSPY